jgi:addiction module HigA family antidote
MKSNPVKSAWPKVKLRFNEIVNGKRRITADTALRLARYFNMTPKYWMGLQSDYDLDLAEDEIAEKISTIA